MPEPGLLDDSPAAPVAAVLRRLAVVAALLIAAAVGGCGGEDPERRKAYDDAQAVVERERATLAAMQREYERLQGEFWMHEFESRIWSGQVSLGKQFGLDVDREAARDHKLSRFFYQKWPLGWFGRVDRLLTQRSDLMPWYNKYQAEAHSRRLRDHYQKRLQDLNDRMTIQRGRVRDAEEYVRIIGPPDGKK